MYAVQTVLHSLTASVLVYCALLAWDLKSPRVKQQFYFMVIFLPVISFPFYQVISPARGDVYFRLGSLLDSNKWFLLEIWGSIPLSVILMILPALTSAVFIIQEFVPIVLHLFTQMRGYDESDDEAIEDSISLKVSDALNGLPLNEDAVEILNDDDLILFSSTGLNPKIHISTGLVESFTLDHLQAAFAHEIGHIRRSRKPALLLAYILRALMFYNPIAMIEFRKVAQEEEKVCDDIAVAMTGKPEALAEAVDMLRPETGPVRDIGGIATAIENHGHDILMKNRILSIRHRHQDEAHWGIPYFITLILIIALNYFIV